MNQQRSNPMRDLRKATAELNDATRQFVEHSSMKTKH